MDNLCHTLAGVAIGEAGARKSTPLAMGALIVGANLPDVDAFAYFIDPVVALGFRRGWTHGVLALALWPLLLTVALLWWDRNVRRRRRPDAPPARAVPLLAWSAVAVVSHPLLDLLNTYGVRLLMPFSGRWFYGDTLFIVDPWILLALLLAAAWAHVLLRKGSARWTWPARGAIALCLAYVAAMYVSGRAVRRVMERELDRRNWATDGVMVAPVPADPLRRVVLFPASDGYYLTTWDARARPRFAPAWQRIPSGVDAPLTDPAAASPMGRTFLRWSRYPYFVAGGDDGCPGGHVCIRDARYPGQAWAEVAIPRAAPVSWGSPSSVEQLP